MNIQAVCPAVVTSPEESVPKGDDGGGVKGTDEYEQQKVEAHHDGKMVSEEPGGAAGMSGQVPPLRVHKQVLDSQQLIVGDYKVLLWYFSSFTVLCSRTRTVDDFRIFFLHLALDIWVIDDFTQGNTAEQRTQEAFPPAAAVGTVQDGHAEVTGEVGPLSKQGVLVEVTVQPIVNDRVKVLQAAPVECIEDVPSRSRLLKPGVHLIAVLQLKQEVWHGRRNPFIFRQVTKFGILIFLKCLHSEALRGQDPVCESQMMIALSGSQSHQLSHTRQRVHIGQQRLKVLIVTTDVSRGEGSEQRVPLVALGSSNKQAAAEVCCDWVSVQTGAHQLSDRLRWERWLHSQHFSLNS